MLAILVSSFHSTLFVKFIFISTHSTQLSKLEVADQVNKIRSDESLNETEKYLKAHEIISPEVDRKFKDISVNSYFDNSSGIVSSKELIEFIDCYLTLWRKPGKFSKPSILEVCDNLLKVRLIDQTAGVCFTLFHEAILKAIHENPLKRIGIDDFWELDEESKALFAGMDHTPKFLYPENGLLRIKIDFNMRANDPRFNLSLANESTDLRDAYGGRFWIHSNRYIPKLSMTGYTLRPGKHYTFYLKRTVYNLLEPPFETRCRNYSKEYREKLLWFPIDLSIPISRESCIDECIVNQSIIAKNDCNCWPTPIPYRRDNQTSERQNLKFCKAEKGHDETCYSNFVPVCEAVCLPDCRQDFYEIMIKERPFIGPSEQQLLDDTKGTLHHLFEDKDDVRKEFDKINPFHPPTVVDIVFATNEETHHNHYPALTIIELIVNVAGLIGLFLSLSADVTIDFLEWIIEKAVQKHKSYFASRTTASTRQ